MSIPGNKERGWNDPPMFLKSKSGEAKSNRSPLNKRVGYPVSSVNSISGDDGNKNRSTTPDIKSYMSSLPVRNGSSTNEPQNPSEPKVILLPPSSSPNPLPDSIPLLVPSLSPTTRDSPLSLYNPSVEQESMTESRKVRSLEIPDLSDDQQLFHFVNVKLQKILNGFEHRLSEKNLDDIRRKLLIFETMWREGKLCEEVKNIMVKLATALREEKYDVAHELHISLMMDYVSEVGQWMVAIKRLIQECLAQSTSSPGSPCQATGDQLTNVQTIEDFNQSNTCSSDISSKNINDSGLEDNENILTLINS